MHEGSRCGARCSETLTSIAIIYRIAGEGIDRESAEMAIELALNKYCSVRDSLDPNIQIEWTLVLNE